MKALLLALFVTLSSFASQAQVTSSKLGFIEFYGIEAISLILGFEKYLEIPFQVSDVNCIEGIRPQNSLCQFSMDGRSFEILGEPIEPAVQTLKQLRKHLEQSSSAKERQLAVEGFWIKSLFCDQNLCRAMLEPLN